MIASPNEIFKKKLCAMNSSCIELLIFFFFLLLIADAIFVRVFEDRMDLLRAVIIGASGTPYQDGLFFFDFYLPPEYPQVPPVI